MTKIILALLKIINFRFFKKRYINIFSASMKNTNFKSTHKRNKERHLQQYTGRASQLYSSAPSPHRLVPTQCYMDTIEISHTVAHFCCCLQAVSTTIIGKKTVCQLHNPYQLAVSLWCHLVEEF